MATTTNFGWETPDDTDLVKDGAAAIRTLGSAIDTSLVDLKGGTTGQVLSKTSNTDMDFTWVTSDDANAIQNTIVDAKGDLIAASAADTPARLAVGNNGESLVADSSATTGLRWQSNFAAGKNAIINGDFRLNQRSFTSTTTSGTYGFDRFQVASTDGTVTYSAQTFTLGAAPVAGYESINFARLVSTGQTLSTARAILQQPIEDVRTFAGQTVTLSFWAKASSGTPSVAASFTQSFGAGGSASVDTAAGKTAITTSWTRYSFTVAIPSISGKTLGTTATSLISRIWVSAGTDFNAVTTSLGIQSVTIDIWGVQLEAGNTATAFQTATGTLAGELAACQRYYWRVTPGTSGSRFSALLGATSGTDSYGTVNNPVPMRTTPTSVDFSALNVVNAGTSTFAVTTLTNNSTLGTINNSGVSVFVASGLTVGQWHSLQTSSASGFIGFSAEL